MQEFGYTGNGSLLEFITFCPAKHEHKESLPNVLKARG
jgi:hypothetical protein